MKSLNQDRELRRQRSASSLPVQLSESYTPHNLEDIREGPSAIDGPKALKRTMPPTVPNRLSIERYLSAPMTDELASVPDISAAIRMQFARDRAILGGGTLHSREASTDIYSDGGRTVFTSGSGPETVGTSYTAESGHKRLQNTYQDGTNTQGQMGTHTSTESVVADHDDMTTAWRERVKMFAPRVSPVESIDYRSRAQEELAHINAKAREMVLRKSRSVQALRSTPAAPVSDESARTLMAKNPKLAKILGEGTGGVMQARSGLSSVSDPLVVKRPASTYDRSECAYKHVLQKSKSSSALNSPPRQKDASKVAIADMLNARVKCFCTFCFKGFDSQARWMKHEQVMHMLEELWICCPRTGELPKTCPFCEMNNPSLAHLADHQYMSCQARPMPERTFDQRAYFLQHIAQVHNVPPEQKSSRLMALENAWKTPRSIRTGHPALHCGFCGAMFRTYEDRTIHVGRHFAKGADLACWWTDRVNHDEQKPQVQQELSTAHLPHQCSYCKRTFRNLEMARKTHPLCAMWSCSFLPSMHHAIYLKQKRHRAKVACCYCNDVLPQEIEGKVNSTLLKNHLIQHNFRACNQSLHFSGQSFRQHLQSDHAGSHDMSLFAGWTLLLKSSRRERPSMFHKTETAETATPARRADTACQCCSLTWKYHGKPSKSAEEVNSMELTTIPRPPNANKSRRKSSTGIRTEATARHMRYSTEIFTQHGTDYSLEGPTSPRSTELQDCALLYRRRVDASTRNRLYVRSRKKALTDTTEQMFRRLPGSTLGILILHSSLVAAVPAHLTNSVDIYPLP